MKNKHSLVQHLSTSQTYRLVSLIIFTFLLLLIPLNLSTSYSKTNRFFAQINNTVNPLVVQASGGLTITKSGPAGPVDVGGEITYELTVINDTGTDLVAPILVTDSVPLYTTCDDSAIGASDENWSSDCMGETALWTLPSGNFTNATTVILTYTVTLTDVLPNGSKIVNDDYRVSQYLENNNIGAQDIGVVTVTTLINAPEWGIEKAISFPTGGLASAGGEIEYTISYFNDSTLAISGTFFITDTIPDFTTLLTNSLTTNATYSGVDAGEVVTWTISSLLASQQGGDVIYRVQVDSPFTPTLKEIHNKVYGIEGANVGVAKPGIPVTITVEASPILSITKWLENPRLAPGSVATYTIEPANLGSAIAEDALITETLPAGLTFISTDVPPVFSDTVNGIFVWSVASLPPAYSGPIQLVAQVDPDMPDGTVITNVVEMSSPSEGATYISYDLVTQVFLRPDVVVSMMGTEKTPHFLPNDPMTYTIYYTNLGTIPAESVIFSVTIGKVEDQSINSTNAQLIADNGTQLTFQHQGSLDVLENGSITIIGQLEPSPWSSAGENLTGITTAEVTPQESFIDNNTATVVRPVRPGPPASWSIYSPDYVGNKFPINKQVEIWVDEIRDIYNNRVYDSTPVQFSLSPLGVANPAVDGTFFGRATTFISSTLVGPSQMTFVIGEVQTVTFNIEFVGPALGIHKSSSPNPVPPGRELAYTIVISNAAGPNAGDVLDAVVTDTFPGTYLTFGGASMPYTVVGPDMYRFEVGSVFGGSPRTIVITGTVDPDTPDFTWLTNTVVVAASNVTTTATSENYTQVIIPVIEKLADPTYVMAGENLTYTIIYKNKGNISLTNVRITDTMPAEVVSIVQTTSSDPNFSVIDSTLPELVFNYPVLPPQSTALITVVAKVANTPWTPTPTEIVNEVVTNNETNGNEDSFTTSSYGVPNVPAQISFNIPSPVGVGSDVPVEVTVRDQYGNLVRNGTLVSFSASPFGTFDPSSGQTSDGVVETTLNVDQTGSTTVIVSSGSMSESQTINVQAPQLNISKTASPDPVAVGNAVTFFIEVTNIGVVDASNVQVSDMLGDNLTFNQASIPYLLSGSEYIFDLGSLDSNETETISMTATVAPWLQGGQSVTNTAWVSATGLSTAPSDTVVVSVFVPTLNKLVSPNPVRAGEAITYTIIYQNQTGSPITNLEIADQMPGRIASLVSIDPGNAQMIDGTLPDLRFNVPSLAIGENVTITIQAEVDTTGWPAHWVDLVNDVTATSGTLVDDWQTTSTGGPGEPANIVLEATPSNAIVGSNVDIIATVTDQYGNPVLNGTVISFSVTAPGNINPNTDDTRNGEANTIVTSNEPEVVIVTATYEDLTAQVPVEFLDESEVNPNLSITKSAAPNPVEPGENLEYTIVVRNTGNVGLTEVVVTDTFDAVNLDLPFLQANPAPGAVVGATYLFDLGNFNVNQQKQINVTVPVQVTAEGTIANTAFANAVELTDGPRSASSFTNIGQITTADNFKKYVTPGFSRAGETVTYTIVYTNDGADTLTNVVISDDLQFTNLATVTIVDSGGGSLLLGSLSPMVFGRESLASGETWTIVLVGVLRETPWNTALTSLRNRVDVTSNQNQSRITAFALSEGAPDVTNQITLQASSASATINSSVTITATLQDQYSNLVLDGTTVNFSVSPIGGVAPGTDVTQSGVAVTALTSAQSGAATVLVTAEGITSSIVITFIEEGYELYLPLVLK